MPVSPERRAALRGFFEDSQRGQNRGVTFVEVSDILGVLDDLDAAERAVAESAALSKFVARVASARCDHDGDACEEWIHQARALVAAQTPASDSPPSAQPPKAEPTAALWSDGRGDAVCSACGAVIECRHDQKYVTGHRPDCPLSEVG